jgi:hypothetical protein
LTLFFAVEVDDGPEQPPLLPGVRNSRQQVSQVWRSWPSFYLLGQLVPTLAIAYLRSHLPAEALGLLLDAP